MILARKQLWNVRRVIHPQGRKLEIIPSLTVGVLKLFAPHGLTLWVAELKLRADCPPH